MNKTATKIIISIFCLIIFFCIVIFGQIAIVLNCSYPIGSRVVVNKENNCLSVDDNADIRILQLADIQISGLGDSLKSFGVIKTIVENAKPDLIVLTGDNIMDDSQPSMLEHIINFFDEFEIPWATVMGNHDYRATAIPMKKQCELYEKSKYCLFKQGEVKNSYGNYHYNLVRNNQTIYTLMFMDNAVEINQQHLDWYTQTLNQINIDNKYSDKIPSMLFFHKPLIDTYYAHLYALNFNKQIDGEKREGIAYVYEDAGIFDKALEIGSTKAIIYGHNHRNNFIVDYYDIKLCFGLKSSKAAYHDTDLIGGNVYVLKADNSLVVERVFV